MKRNRRSRKDPESRVSGTEAMRVVSSDEENPRRETEVDTEDERVALFGSEKDESIPYDDPLRVSVPTDQPLDITPRDESDGEGLGMVDQPDAETVAEYEEAEREARRDRRTG